MMGTRACPACGRETQLVGRRRQLANHKDPKKKGQRGGWCSRSSTVVAAEPGVVVCGPDEIDETVGEADNAGHGATGFYDGGPDPQDRARLEQVARRLRLAEWWAGKASAEIGMVVDKAIEYGATDLRDIGLQLLEMGGKRYEPEWGDLDRYATEVGIVFYVLGKVSRLVAAVKEGRQPSFDTWLDIGVYARMAQRVHETGGWPGV